MEEKIREIEKRLIKLTGTINYTCHLVEEIYMLLDEGKRNSIQAKNTSETIRNTLINNPMFKNNPVIKDMVNNLFDIIPKNNKV